MKPMSAGVRGYAFALPRAFARLRGEPVKRAELSRWEAYGLGILVFGIGCLFFARCLGLFVRPNLFSILALLLLPFVVWIVYLLQVYLVALLIRIFRRLGLYRSPTNNPFQHFVVMLLTTLEALYFLAQNSFWLRSLGGFWLALLASNLLAKSWENLRPAG